MAQVALKVVLLNHTKKPEETIAHAAKLCYSPASIEQLKNTIEESDNEKFVKRLLQLGHLSPLEHAIFTFGVEGISRVCSHQLVRHRIASYSQQSQRYVGERRKEESDIFDFVIPPSIEASGRKDWFIDKMRQIQDWYDDIVEVLGDTGEKSNEDARFLLPNAAETKIVVTMNVRELIHFFSVRCCERAQWEIRDLATEMLRLTRKVLPGVFSRSGPNCVKGPCAEGKMTCGNIESVREKFRNL